MKQILRSDNLGSARNAHNQASNELKVVSEKLTTCERDIARENNLLEDNQQKLHTVTDEIEDLTTDIVNSETRFWESLPDIFHGIGLEDAVNQFADKIEAVAAREQELGTKKNQLDLLNADLRANQRKLESIEERHKELQAEIERLSKRRKRLFGRCP